MADPRTMSGDTHAQTYHAHEPDPAYLQGAAMALHQTDVAGAPIEGTGRPVRLCKHCQCLYAESHD